MSDTHMFLTSGDCLIVSGASFGVGRALAPLLAQEGVNLVLNARSAGALEEAVRECRSYGVQAVAVAGDISRESIAGELVRNARDMGGFAGFIQVAGLLHPGPTVWELPAAEAAAVMNAGYGGTLALIRQAVPVLLKQKRGLAVAFGSGAAELQQPGISIYCAAKAAQEALLKGLAAETRDITVFIYRPGVVRTRMQTQALESKGGAAHILRPVFKSWKGADLMMTPEVSAARLIKVLKGDLSPLHGRIVDARKVGPV